MSELVDLIYNLGGNILLYIFVLAVFCGVIFIITKIIEFPKNMYNEYRYRKALKEKKYYHFRCKNSEEKIDGYFSEKEYKEILAYFTEKASHLGSNFISGSVYGTRIVARGEIPPTIEYIGPDDGQPYCGSCLLNLDETIEICPYCKGKNYNYKND